MHCCNFFTWTIDLSAHRRKDAGYLHVQQREIKDILTVLEHLRMHGNANKPQET